MKKGWNITSSLWEVIVILEYFLVSYRDRSNTQMGPPKGGHARAYRSPNQKQQARYRERADRKVPVLPDGNTLQQRTQDGTPLLKEDISKLGASAVSVCSTAKKNLFPVQKTQKNARGRPPGNRIKNVRRERTHCVTISFIRSPAMASICVSASTSSSFADPSSRRSMASIMTVFAAPCPASLTQITNGMPNF